MVDAGIERREASRYCALPAAIPVTDSARRIREAYRDLDTYLGERQIEDRGPSIIRYRRSSEKGPLDVEVGWIIDNLDRIDAPFVIDMLPAGVYVVGWHNGPYRRIGETTRELIAWGDERHVTWDVEPHPEGDRWASWFELYLTEPSFGPEGPMGSVEVCVGIRDEEPAELREG
jgi:effector-binding domain-containing protein